MLWGVLRGFKGVCGESGVLVYVLGESVLGRLYCPRLGSCGGMDWWRGVIKIRKLWDNGKFGGWFFGKNAVYLLKIKESSPRRYFKNEE